MGTFPIDACKDMKLPLQGYLKPGEQLHRNVLFDQLFSSLPRDPQVKVQIYNAEIAPGGFTGGTATTERPFSWSCRESSRLISRRAFSSRQRREMCIRSRSRSFTGVTTRIEKFPSFASGSV